MTRYEGEGYSVDHYIECLGELLHANDIGEYVNFLIGHNPGMELSDIVLTFSDDCHVQKTGSAGSSKGSYTGSGGGGGPLTEVGIVMDDLEMSEDNPGVPVDVPIETAEVSVAFAHTANSGPGAWTLRLYKMLKGTHTWSEAATFSVDT